MPNNAAISADQMKLVLDVSRLLAVTADLKLLLRRIAEAATSLLNAERASIYLHDPKTHELWTQVALGTEQIRIPEYAGIAGHVFRTGQVLNIPNAYEDARFNRDVDKATGYVTRNLLTSPMLDLARHPVGVIQAVNKVGGAFLETDEAILELLADQAGVAIQRYQLQLQAIESVELRREMDLAKKVQEAIIPKRPPKIGSLNVVGWTRAASITGGDCFDLWAMPDEQLGVFLGDASGHGLAPALVVLQARTLLRALCEMDQDPCWLMQRVNQRLSQDLEADRFVTAFAASISVQGLVRWFSAGHGPIIVRRSPRDPIQVLEAQAPPLGVLPELDGGPAAAIQLEPGGYLMVLSDGIIEAMDPQRQLLGIESVLAVLEESGDEPPEQVKGRLLQAVRDWQRKDEPVDDQTLVLVQYGK